MVLPTIQLHILPVLVLLQTCWDLVISSSPAIILYMQLKIYVHTIYYTHNFVPYLGSLFLKNLYIQYTINQTSKYTLYITPKKRLNFTIVRSKRYIEGAK